VGWCPFISDQEKNHRREELPKLIFLRWGIQGAPERVCMCEVARGGTGKRLSVVGVVPVGLSKKRLKALVVAAHDLRAGRN